MVRLRALIDMGPLVGPPTATQDELHGEGHQIGFPSRRGVREIATGECVSHVGYAMSFSTDDIYNLETREETMFLPLPSVSSPYSHCALLVNGLGARGDYIATRCHAAPSSPLPHPTTLP